MEIWDAVFGVMIAVWLDDLADDVFAATSLTIGYDIPIDIFKILFAINSIIFIASLARFVTKWRLFLKKFTQTTTMREFITASQSTLFILIGVYGFILTTSNIIDTTISSYKWMMFFLILPVWMITETVNSWDAISHNIMDHGPKQGNYGLNHKQEIAFKYKKEQKMNIQDQITSYPRRPKIEEIPKLASSLVQVYKVGSLPLALLFVAAIILLALIGKGVIEASYDFLITITYIAGFLFFSGIVTFWVLSIIGYHKWKEELKARADRYKIEIERYRLELQSYESIYKAEIKLQVDSLSIISDQVNKIVKATPNMNPDIIEKSMRSIIDTVLEFLPEIMEVRKEIKKPERKIIDD